jgi:hypothetical protein
MDRIGWMDIYLERLGSIERELDKEEREIRRRMNAHD